MPYELSDLMQIICSERAEAVHLHQNEAPVLEVKQLLHRIQGPPLAPGETEALLAAVAPQEELWELRTNNLASFHFHFGETADFQIMAFREEGVVRLELRRLR